MKRGLEIKLVGQFLPSRCGVENIQVTHMSNIDVAKRFYECASPMEVMNFPMRQAIDEAVLTTRYSALTMENGDSQM